jgi:hypothetical protein
MKVGCLADYWEELWVGHSAFHWVASTGKKSVDKMAAHWVSIKVDWWAFHSVVSMAAETVVNWAELKGEQMAVSTVLQKVEW